VLFSARIHPRPCNGRVTVMADGSSTRKYRSYDIRARSCSFALRPHVRRTRLTARRRWTRSTDVKMTSVDRDTASNASETFKRHFFPSNQTVKTRSMNVRDRRRWVLPDIMPCVTPTRAKSIPSFSAAASRLLFVNRNLAATDAVERLSSVRLQCT
jgi:hypothetical protein